MSERPASMEKEPSRWEPITNSARDAEDICALNLVQNGGSLESDTVAEHGASVDSGLILRRNNAPIGCMLFSVLEYDSKKILYVTDLFIRPEDRSPGVVRKLVHALKSEARRLGADSVGWTAGSEMMSRISYKVSPGGSGNYIVPIEQLDLDSFKDRI